jgi:hypothetical protein
MITNVRRFGMAALAGLAVCGALSSPAHARQRRPGMTTTVTPAPVVNPFLNPFFGQNRVVPFIPSLAAQSINRNPYLNEFTTLGQASFNTAVLGRALSNVPPYLLGYNPYPQLINYGPSYPTAAPYGSSTLSTVGASNPYLGGGYGGATLTTNPYLGGSGSSGYGSSGQGGGYLDPYLAASNPYNGYLRGAADVTTANANYQMTIQQARLVREQANQAHLQTRRHIIEEAEWERGRIPSPEKVREADTEAALNRARRDPPLTEVWSARALNSLLDHLAAEQGRGAKGPTVPLDEETLKSINLTPADSRANAGLLKDGGKLQWPLPLQADEFKGPRTRLSRLLEEAVQKLRFNPNAPVPAGLVKDMQNDLTTLTELLNDSVGELSPSQYIEAKRYLNQVGDAMAALSDPKVGAYFNQGWVSKVRNVAELVHFMSRSGLRFAAATPGDEPAYNALYRALADFDAGMPQVAQKPSAPATPRE